MRFVFVSSRKKDKDFIFFFSTNHESLFLSVFLIPIKIKKKKPTKQQLTITNACSYPCSWNGWEFLKASTVRILLCRGVSCGIHLSEGKEFRCPSCAYVCAHWSYFEGLYVFTKKLEKLDIWEWKLVVFQAILDLKVLNPLINKPRFRLECLGLILKVILRRTSSCWLASEIIICTFQSYSAISSAWGLNVENVISLEVYYI